jgi:hypothetical protein
MTWWWLNEASLAPPQLDGVAAKADPPGAAPIRISAPAIAAIPLLLTRRV